MTEYTDAEWLGIKFRALELGREHGTRVGESYPIDDVPAARRVLDGIDTCDEGVTDTLPRDPLSGEWAGDYGIQDLLRELGVGEDSDDGVLARQFEDTYTRAAEEVITKRASDMIQATVTLDRSYVAVVDRHFRDMLTANSTEPYVHAEYERHKRMAYAALTLLTLGDQKYADALALAFHDSNLGMAYYIREWTRRDLLAWAHIDD